MYASLKRVLNLQEAKLFADLPSYPFPPFPAVVGVRAVALQHGNHQQLLQGYELNKPKLALAVN